MRSSLAVCLLAICAACSAETVVTRDIGCGLPRSGDRWGGLARLAPDTLLDTARTRIDGVAQVGSELFVFDGSEREVVRYDSRGLPAGRIARSGDGPGEIAYPRKLQHEGHTEWLGARGDTLVILDGNALHFYSRAGANIRSIAIDDGAVRTARLPWPKMTPRLRVSSDALLVGTLVYTERGAQATSQPRTFGIYDIDMRGEMRAVYQRPLIPLTLLPNGGISVGVAEARPLWDVAGHCYIIADGASDFVELVNPLRSEVDTVPLGALDRVANDTLARREMARLGVDVSRWIAPTLPMRVRNLTVDPDGWLWVLPVQPTDLQGRIEVLRVNMYSRERHRDTVPFFPILFREQAAYGIVRAAEDIPRVVRAGISRGSGSDQRP